MTDAVALVACADYTQQELDRSLQNLMALQPALWGQIKKGMLVYIKANLLMPATPESAKTTHPALIHALAKEVIRRGASVIVGDSAGGLPYTESYMKLVYESLHLPALAEKTGFTLNHDFSQTERRFPEGKALRSIPLTEKPLNCDLIINLGKCKTHGLTAYTGVTKNLYGMIPGSLKMELHARFADMESFSQALVDIALCVKPQIHVLDAVVGMEGEGPSGGKPRKIGALLAGANPFALDAIGAQIIGYEVEEVPYLKCALERNLFTKEIPLLGEKAERFRIPDFAHPLSTNTKKPFSALSLVFFGQTFMRLRLKVDSSLCIGCGRCMQVCPHKAIHMENKKPVFDPKRCRQCLCCQELCPQAAILVKRALLSRLLCK